MLETNRLNRREFVKAIGAGALVLSVPAGIRAAQSKPKTNIVLIMADDLGYECLGS